MYKKYLELQDSDLQQLVLLSRIIAEGKFEIKGDAILTVAGSLRYLGQLSERVKNAQPLPEPAKVEMDTSNVKGRRRAK